MSEVNILDAFVNVPEAINFILPGLPFGVVGSVISPGGVGKSAFALSLACQIAGGPCLTGLKSNHIGKVVYVAGEDPANVIEHRIHAVGEHCNQVERVTISENLKVISACDVVLDILSSKTQEYFTSLAEGSTLLILDTLRVIHAADENDSGAMSNVIGHLKRIANKTQCSIIFLHHTNKNSMNNAQGNEQQASRGSSVLVDNIRWQGYLTGISDKTAKELEFGDIDRKYYVSFGISKQNYGLPVDELILKKVSSKNPAVTGYCLKRFDAEARKLEVITKNTVVKNRDYSK